MDTNKRNRRLILLCIMAYCAFSFTIGKLIPLYFTNEDLSFYYNILIGIILAACIGALPRAIVSNAGIKRPILTLFYRLTIVGGAFSILMLFILLGTLTRWTTAATCYISKSNPDVKITSRYINLGAWGGGTSKDDYKTTIDRPITPLFRWITTVDTNKINKAEWKKPIQ